MKTNIFRSILAAGLVLFSTAHVSAQSTLDKSLLWKISGNGLEQESYLFGTIHIICEDDFKMDDKVVNALNASGKVVLEIDMSDPNFMAEMQQMSMNPGFANIKGEFSPETATALDEILLNAYGANLDQLGILKPFVLSSMVMLKMLPCTEQKSYETYFVEQAQTMELPMAGLETVAYQMGIFDEIPAKIQIQEIEKMIADSNGTAEFNKLVSAYVEEDLDGLYALMTGNGMFQEFSDVLLTQRNKNWIPLMADMMKEQSVFFGVGSGHLPSETGVIALLRDAGYTVEAVQ